MIRLIISLIPAFVLITGCEKFTGYDYDSESVSAKSRIYGTVSNTFDKREPVVGADIKIGYLTTHTDSAGHYDADYFISTDDNRNKPVELLITAKDYHNLYTEFLVFPPENKMDFYMEYGAPIIEMIWIGVPEEIMHQVRITDYQGIDNIRMVTTGIYYVKFDEVDIRIETIEMRLFQKISDISAYYYATALPSLPDGWFYDPDDPTHIRFRVEDYDGFSDLVDRKSSNLMSPVPLFPPDAAP